MSSAKRYPLILHTSSSCHETHLLCYTEIVRATQRSICRRVYKQSWRKSRLFGGEFFTRRKNHVPRRWVLRQRKQGRDAYGGSQGAHKGRPYYGRGFVQFKDFHVKSNVLQVKISYFT